MTGNLQSIPRAEPSGMDVGIWIDPVMLDREAALVRHLIVGIKSEGHRATIIASADQDLSSLPTLGSRVLTYRDTKLDRALLPARRLSAVATALRDTPIDVLAVWGAAAAAPVQAFQHALNVPMVVWCWEPGELNNPILRLPMARHVVVPSSAVAEGAAKHLPPVTVVQPGVFCEDHVVCYDNDQDVPCMVCLDTLSSAPAYEPMLQACKRLAQAGSDFMLFAYDTGREEHVIWKIARRLELLERISFVPYRQQAESLLLNADIYLQVIPETRYTYRTLEAMARGLAVVSRANAVADFLVDRQTCRVVPDAGIDSWQAALQEMLTDRQRAAQLARKGQQLARERHSISRMAGQFAGICRQAAGIPIPLAGP